MNYAMFPAKTLKTMLCFPLYRLKLCDVARFTIRYYAMIRYFVKNYVMFSALAIKTMPCLPPYVRNYAMFPTLPLKTMLCFPLYRQKLCYVSHFTVKNHAFFSRFTLKNHAIFTGINYALFPALPLKTMQCLPLYR